MLTGKGADFISVGSVWSQWLLTETADSSKAPCKKLLHAAIFIYVAKDPLISSPSSNSKLLRTCTYTVIGFNIKLDHDILCCLLVEKSPN